MKKALSSVAVLSLLLLAGAGCSGTQPETKQADQTTPTENTAPTVTETNGNAPETTPATEIKLTAEALGGNRVKFTWELPNGMENPASFRLVRGPSENPESPRSYWFQLLGDKRETTWIGLAPGKQYFRICTFVDNKCAVYSNNVEVDVK